MTDKEQIVKNVVDGTAAATGIVALLADWMPVLLATLGAMWFVLRFINFARVNVFRCRPWYFS